MGFNQRLDFIFQTAVLLREHCQYLEPDALLDIYDVGRADRRLENLHSADVVFVGYEHKVEVIPLDLHNGIFDLYCCNMTGRMKLFLDYNGSWTYSWSGWSKYEPGIGWSGRVG